MRASCEGRQARRGTWVRTALSFDAAAPTSSCCLKRLDNPFRSAACGKSAREASRLYHPPCTGGPQTGPSRETVSPGPLGSGGRWGLHAAPKPGSGNERNTCRAVSTHSVPPTACTGVTWEGVPSVLASPPSSLHPPRSARPGSRCHQLGTVRLCGCIGYYSVWL